MLREKVAPEKVHARLAEAFLALDIRALIEEHGNILLPGGDAKRQLNGPCPWRNRGECTAKENGFMVWTTLSDRGRHYYCRQCRKSGSILDLVMQLKGISFKEACLLLNIPNPYVADGVWIAPAPLARNASLPTIDPKEQERLENLHLLYPRMQAALQMKRARAYLEQRAIPFDLAQAQGIGYLPALTSISEVTPELANLRPWCDRIIFPIHTTSGELAYAGRSLFLWEPGMDEDEHKQRFDEYKAQMQAEGRYAVPRWIYTHLGGYYNWPVVARLPERLILVEGPFDALACLACGLDNAISIGTAGIPASAIPLQIDDVIMALDIDGPGRNAARKLAKDLRRKGIQVELRAPDSGKDWSAAYRLHGWAGLAPLLPTIPAQLPEITGTAITGQMGELATVSSESRAEPHEEILLPDLPGEQSDELASDCWICGAEVEYYSEHGRAYCGQHWHRDQFSPEEIAAIFARNLAGWTVELVQGEPIKEVKPLNLSKRGFWEEVERQIAKPPLNVHTGRPMMSRERWAKCRAAELAWRPNPALLAHKKA